MKTSDFGERVSRLYEQTAGGKQIFVTGRTVMRQVVVLGSVLGPLDRPFLYAVQAPITDETGEDERLAVTQFRTEPGFNEVRWLTVGGIARAALRNSADAVRLVLPTGPSNVRYMVDGALLTPASDMIPGIEPAPTQQLPPSLEALSKLLVGTAPAQLRAVA